MKFLRCQIKGGIFTNRSRASGVLLGLIVIFCSLLFLGKGLFGWNLGFFAATWWALVIIAVSVISMVHSRIRFWNAAFFVFGCCLLLRELGLLGRYSSVTIFAVILLLIGVWIIYTAVGGHKVHSCADNQNCTSEGNKSNEDYPDYSCAFSTYNVSCKTRQFKGGRASCYFGTMRLDLSEIDIEQHAVLDVSSYFGSMQIIMPRNIPYKTDVISVLGAFQNYAPIINPLQGTPFLEIKGSTAFGRIELK